MTLVDVITGLFTTCMCRTSGQNTNRLIHVLSFVVNCIFMICILSSLPDGAVTMGLSSQSCMIHHRGIRITRTQE